MSFPATSDCKPRRISAGLYLLCLLLLTTLGVGTAMWLRPAFAYSIRSTLGLVDAVPAPPESFYAVRVAPLLEEHCTACHGAGRKKADLRLDSFAATMRGGKHGPVILQGDLKHSELMVRLTLPPEHEKAMPPPGKAPLSADDVTVIKLWIAAGASRELPVAAIKDAPPPVVKVEFPEIDAAAVAKARAPLAESVRQLQQRFPGVISYQSRGSADLQLNASLMGRAFGDRELSALAPLRERIVYADLSGTSITDGSAQTLTGYTQLRTLRLANTGVTAAAMQTLASLPALKSLSVVGVAVTKSFLAELRGKGVRVYDGHELSPEPNAKS